MPNKPHQKPDPDILRHQCEVEHIPIKVLFPLYGYKSKTDLYAYCKAWGITPFREPGPYDHIRAIDLTPEQHQIVLGAILGDASILVYKDSTPDWLCPMRLTQGQGQEAYLEWKKEKLSLYFPRAEPKRYVNTGLGAGTVRLEYNSIPHPAFTMYRKLFYPGGKKHLSLEILNRLEPQGIAVWLMDDGSFNKPSGWIQIASHSFSREENEMTAQWFWDRWRIQPFVYQLRSRGLWFLEFNRPAVQALVPLVRDYFFPPLLYKLGDGVVLRRERGPNHRGVEPKVSVQRPIIALH